MIQIVYKDCEHMEQSLIILYNKYLIFYYCYYYIIIFNYINLISASVNLIGNTDFFSVHRYWCEELCKYVTIVVPNNNQ